MVEAIYQNLRSRLGEIQVACLAPLRCFQASNSSYTKDEVDNFTCTASYSSILSIFIPSSCEIKQVCSAGRIGRHQPALGIQSIRSRLAWKMPVPQSPPNRTCLTRSDKQDHGIPRTPLKIFEVWSRIHPDLSGQISTAAGRHALLSAVWSLGDCAWDYQAVHFLGLWQRYLAVHKMIQQPKITEDVTTCYD